MKTQRLLLGLTLAYHGFGNQHIYFQFCLVTSETMQEENHFTKMEKRVYTLFFLGKKFSSTELISKTGKCMAD